MRRAGPLPVSAATPGRASPAAGTRLSTQVLRWAASMLPSTCPVSRAAPDGRAVYPWERTLRPLGVERPEPGLRRLPGPVNTGAALPHGNRFCGSNCAPAWTDERVLFVLTTPLLRRQQAPRAKGQAPVCAHRAWPDASELSKARHPVEASR